MLAHGQQQPTGATSACGLRGSPTRRCENGQVDRLNRAGTAEVGGNQLTPRHDHRVGAVIGSVIANGAKHASPALGITRLPQAAPSKHDEKLPSNKHEVVARESPADVRDNHHE